MSARDQQAGGLHYKDFPIQPLEYSMANALNACQANVIKYVTRYEYKHPLDPAKQIEDLQKAKHMIDWLIEDIIRDNPGNHVEKNDPSAYNPQAEGLAYQALKEKQQQEEAAWDKWREGQSFRRFNDPPGDPETITNDPRHEAYLRQLECSGGACDI